MPNFIDLEEPDESEEPTGFCTECGAVKYGTDPATLCPTCKNNMLEDAYWDRRIDEARGK